ncbi:hypothetical protein NMY22_g8195 [Coprinellus aureogranulatus]|nr:hypothetical protein NMY22_g8195 [Coprinellus aureogranulatus]
MAPVMSCLIPSNPDVSGIGVRIAIYIQNLLCFIPALWALWDGKVTNYEMDSAEAHSTTNLVLAFAILISCIFQALARGLTNYHGSIILSLSWMNNTNAFIYFLLYVQHKSQGEAGIVPKKRAWIKHIKTQVMTIFCLNDGLRGWWPFGFGGVKKHRKRIEGPGAAKVLFKRITLLLGSLHLTLMAALGIWLWSAPHSFGASETAGCVTQVADLAVIGAHIRFGSLAFRIASLTMYSLILIPGFNLVLPMALFVAFHCWYHSRRPRESILPEHSDSHNTRALASADTQDIEPEATASANLPGPPSQRPPSPSGVVLSASIRQVLPVHVGLLFLLAVNIIFIADIELTLQRNGHLQTEEESQWGFGQILALLLIFMPLRDLVEALFRRRQEMQTKLNDALKTAIGEKNLNEISRWVGAGADVDVQMDGQTALDVAFSREDQHQLVSLLETKGIDLREVLITAIDEKNFHYISRCATYGADVRVQGADSQTALDVAFTQEDQHQLVSLLVTKGIKLARNVTVQGADGQTALDVALLQEDQDDLVSILVSKGASLSQAFVKTINAKDCERIARSVGAGADTNTEAPDGCTALDVALLRDDQDLTALLVANGVDLDKGLIKAVNAKDCKRISVLAKAGADVNAQGADRLTALDVALLQDGRDDLTSLLVAKVSAGAKVNAKTAGGHTALDIALLRDGREDLTSLLVAKGANLGHALINAINARDCERISRSIVAGADVNTEGSECQTALDIALLQSDQDEFVSLLVEKGADLDRALIKAINATDYERGQTALDVALLRDDQVHLVALLATRGADLDKILAKAIDVKDCERISRLVNAGAGINVEGAGGHTALDVALLQEDQGLLVSLLLAKGVNLNKALIKAINAKDCERISRSVDAGADARLQTAEGRTALDVALSREDQDRLISLLLEKGADSDRALTKAINAKDCIRITRLVTAGADINAKGDERRTALDVAFSQTGQKQLIRLLISKGVDLNKALIEAISANNTDSVSGCVEYGAGVRVHAADGRTALDVAFSRQDQHRLIGVLVKKGVNLDRVLTQAITDKNFHYISQCVYYGADVNVNAPGGETALEVTILEKQWDLVGSIVEAGANVNQQFRSGAPTSVLEFLLEKDANPNAQGGDYTRACLHEACREGREDVVSLLLKYKADPTIRDTLYRTPLHSACANGHSKCAQILLEGGANINAQKVDGWTALHLACNNGHVDCVKLLLECGANTSIKDIAGKTVFQHESQRKHSEVLELLLSYGVTK